MPLTRFLSHLKLYPCSFHGEYDYATLQRGYFQNISLTTVAPISHQFSLMDIGLGETYVTPSTIYDNPENREPTIQTMMGYYLPYARDNCFTMDITNLSHSIIFTPLLSGCTLALSDTQVAHINILTPTGEIDQRQIDYTLRTIFANSHYVTLKKSEYSDRFGGGVFAFFVYVNGRWHIYYQAYYYQTGEVKCFSKSNTTFPFFPIGDRFFSHFFCN